MITGAQTFLVDSETLELLKSRAERGDMDAAFSIAKHYGFGLADDLKEKFWLERAATLGHKEAQEWLLNDNQYNTNNHKDKVTAPK